jgi:hypothetical protein
MAASNLFSWKISWPHCRQAGFVAWEGQDEAAPRIAFLSRGFHPEQRRESAAGLRIVCDVCDEVQDGLSGGVVH